MKINATIDVCFFQAHAQDLALVQCRAHDLDLAAVVPVQEAEVVRIQYLLISFFLCLTREVPCIPIVNSLKIFIEYGLNLTKKNDFFVGSRSPSRSRSGSARSRSKSGT